MIVDTMLSY